MGYAYITTIKNVKKHSNADKLNVGECFGNQVIVSLETKNGDLGVYFATDSQIGEEYASKNNLLERKDENGVNIGGYLNPSKRNIRALKLRGEVSDGLYMPIKSLECIGDTSDLKIGDCVDIFNGVTIAQKYIPIKTQAETSTTPKKQANKKIKDIEFPLFEEHIDTSQYAYNKHVFKEGDLITITLKMHGTSQRCGNLIKREYTKPTRLNKLLMSLRLKKMFTEKYDIVTGTRRVTLTNFNKGGYYGNDDAFRKNYHDLLSTKLKQGETIYFEIVGFLPSGKPIMASQSNDKIQDKSFSKQYGKETVFSYGCEVGKNEMYAYRMTMTSQDGEVVEYPTWLIQQRCEEMGINFVPVFDQFIFTTLEDLENRVNALCDGVDPIGKTHVREGVVIRVENRKTFKAYKHKNFSFKCLEGLIKDAGIVDLEEQESIKGE